MTNKVRLESPQRNAVEKIICSLNNEDKRKIKVKLPVGFGFLTIISEVIRYRLESEKGILVLFDNKIGCEQFKKKIMEYDDIQTQQIDNKKGYFNGKLKIHTYNSADTDYIEGKLVEDMSLIICRNEPIIDSKFIKKICSSENIKIVALETAGQQIVVDRDERWFDSFELIYSYSQEQAIKEGYSYRFLEYEKIENFFIELLKNIGYRNIKRQERKGKFVYDIIAEKESKNVFEIKAYKGINNSLSSINNAIAQIEQMKKNHRTYNDKYIFNLIMFCYVDKNMKMKAEKKNIRIWDIANIKYFCQYNEDLARVLSDIVNYSITDVNVEKPLWWEDCSEEIDVSESNENMQKYDEFKERLDKCERGSEDIANVKYENICTDIIEYLFEGQFSANKQQHVTKDKMFRMDLICSIKEGIAFWDFLMDFYRTKFVVFEFKNHTKQLSQNYIYITEKYLYSPVLRNVAIIISRNGFDNNAKKAALGCLIEDGKLIMDITDKDLLEMINIKDNGEEPSDYLMEKMEQFFMSVSK